MKYSKINNFRDFFNFYSDVNGSLNILRKYVKDKCIPKLIQSVMDNGALNTPLRIRVA